MIKFDKIVENKEYRERVIKYFRLPMRLSVSLEKFNSDMEFIKETNPVKYAQIIEFTERDFNKLCLEQNTDTPDFTMENILEPIVREFESTPQWQEFLTKDYSDVLDGYEGITNTHAFYRKENDGKHLLSIDLEAANWQSLQSVIGFDETYEELIIKHTDNLIPVISKTFRTKITGVIGAKNILNYNKKLLKDNKEAILNVILKTTGIDLRGREPFAFYADEFILEISKADKKAFNSMDIGCLEKEVYNATGIKIHFRPFTLNWLNLTKACAKINKGKFEIINIAKDDLMLFEKLRRGMVPSEIDFEGAKFKGKLGEVQNAVDRVNELIKIQ